MPLKPSSIWNPVQAGKGPGFVLPRLGEVLEREVEADGMRWSDISSAPTVGNVFMSTGMGRWA